MKHLLNTLFLLTILSATFSSCSKYYDYLLEDEVIEEELTVNELLVTKEIF